MKINAIKHAALLAAVVASFGTTGVQASDSLSVTVNATIVGVCKFNTLSPVVNLTNTATGSNIDPSSASSATGNAAINYKCSNGTTPTFTVPTSATVTCSTCSGTPTMSPAITSTNGGAGTGMGSGQDKVLTVTGTIVATNFQNAAAGAYTGTMTVSVSP